MRTASLRIADEDERLEPQPTRYAANSAWWELHIAIAPEQEDITFWRLQEFGCNGMSSERDGPQLHLRAYMPIEQATPLDLSALALIMRRDALLCSVEPPQVHWERLEEEDWSSSWKQHWQPQAIGETILVCPAWLEVPENSDRHVLRMDPGVAFGTGAHTTTQLCIEALEMHLGFLEPNEKVTVADIGCGSGILSLAAAKLGAERVYAVDTDAFAVEATQFNIRNNGLDGKIEIHRGSLDALPRMVDGLICNILAEVAIDLIPQFQLAIRENGWLVLSGIAIEQAKMVSQTLEAHGWMVAALWKRQEWCCLNVRRH
ncbi:50S ribosomal protein L11 methyltransferase [Synechococcus sp. PCC 7336]|uniref:50S ribosomal protein L11 methyltransferase n=1 Tax=Synechococcus sp. PCC 7336 TaxID=195250 RepID=UPI0003493A65|nr:50S ribosomal protein L11 methyltransferase [Synechococcus sp. PCC 7336]